MKIPTTILLLYTLYSANAQWVNQYPEIPLQSFNYADPRFEIFDIDNKTLVISQNSGFLIDENGKFEFSKSLNNNSPFNNHSYISYEGSLYQGIKFSTGLRIRRFNSNFDVLDSLFIRSPNIVSDDFGVTGELVFVVLYQKFKHTSIREEFILTGYNMSGNIEFMKKINASNYDPNEIDVELKGLTGRRLALQFKYKDKFWAPLASGLSVIDVDTSMGDYVSYRFLNEPLYDGGFVFVGDTAYLTAQSRYSTGLSIVDISRRHIGTYIFSHIGDIWSNDIDYNNGKIGTLSTSNDHIVFRCMDEVGNVINEEVINHKCGSYHPDFGHYASFVKNHIGGFTFGYSVIDFTNNLLYPHIFKTDSTCQIQDLQTFEPDIVQKNFTHRDIRIFPNPSFDVFQVSGELKLIRVYDATGKFIKESRSRKIDLSQHPDGMYFVRVGVSTYKIIKQ